MTSFVDQRLLAAFHIWHKVFGVARLAILALGLQILVFGPVLAQQRTDLQGIVPGNELEWEIQELRASVVVSKATILNLQIYSPGFDPTDYRSALKGKNELGDERYDKGKGQIVAEFSLSRDGQVIQRQTYGVEKHRWVVFYRAQVQPGVYTLTSRLMGLGKNAFRYRIQTSVPQAAQLLVDPTLQVYDVRKSFNPLTITTVRGPTWVEPFVLEVTPGAFPFKVGFYDEDGSKEMLGRVRLPDGRIEKREVSGDKSWAYYEVKQEGIIRFGFAQNPQSKQYSNTVGFQVNACLQVGQNRFVVVPPKAVNVGVVDLAGTALDIQPQISGEQVREVSLPELPEGYSLERIETKGGERLPGDKVRFGCAGGSAQFVLNKPQVVELPAPDPQVIVVPSDQQTPVEPTPIEPRTEPAPVDPTPAEPIPLELTPTEVAPVPVDPTPVDPTPPDPTPPDTQPTPTEPPAQPVPMPVPEAVYPAFGKLQIESYLELPSGEQTLDFPVKVDDQNVQIVDGQAILELSPGSVALQPQLVGARIEGPATADIESNKTTKAVFKVYPQTNITLEANKTEFRVGEEVILTARASTGFSRFLPADIRIELPSCLVPIAAPRLVAPISANRQGVLQIRVRATCKGDFSAVARLEPWQQQAQVPLRVIQPAAFTLSKEVVTPEAQIGSNVVYRLRVRNVGQEAGQVRVTDGLARGLQGTPLDQTVQLGPDEEKVLEVNAKVGSDAPESIVNTANLLDEAGNSLGQAQATLKVLRPKAELTRSLDKHLVVPGETVEVSLKVQNAGLSALNYTLSDTYPEWLEPLDSTEFKGQLQPGANQTHTYKARVRLGPESEAQFLAQLLSNGGNPQAPDSLKRIQVTLEKKALAPKVVVGNSVDFLIRLSNPTDHPLSLELQEAPDPDLRLEVPENLKFELKPGETQELRLTAKPQRIGTLENQVTAFLDGVPAAFPVKASVEVLPILEPLRLSTIQMPFHIEGQGERLLLTHLPPSEGQYELGSARLDGIPIPDPKVDSAGRFYFDLPFAADGVLSYSLRHRDNLPALEDSTLTLQTGDREIFMQGHVGYGDLAKTHPLQLTNRDGFIKQPLPGTIFRVDRASLTIETPYGLEGQVLLNGEPVDAKNLGKGTYDSAKGIQRLEFFGLPLKPGQNLIEVQTSAGSDRVEVFLASNPVRLEARPLRLLADGRTPLEFELLALDESGLPSGFGPLTVEALPEPIDTDAFPMISGYQVLLRDGRAVLHLKPQATPNAVRLNMQFERVSGKAEFFATGKQTSLWQVQGSVGIRIGSAIEGFCSMRGYLESPLGNGTIRAATDGSLRFDKGTPVIENGLNPTPDPFGRFPLTGSGTESQLPLSSDDPVAIRYDQANTSLGYYAGQISLPGLTNLMNGTAFRAMTRGDLELQGFAGWLSVPRQTDEIVPDGTRHYHLSKAADSGSEQVVVRVGATETKLLALRDYVLDAQSGTLTLAKPLWPTDANFDEVRLVVSYSPQGGARELGYGAGARYNAGGFSLGAGVASLSKGVPTERDLRYGAELAYQSPDLNFKLSYIKASTERLGLDVNGKQGPLEASANLSYQSRTQGQARLAYNLTEQDKVSLEHQADQQNQTGLLYSRKLPNFSIGGGIGYTWETQQTAVLGRVGLTNGPLNIELTHSQPFSLTAQTQTRLRSSYSFDENLSAEANLIETWGDSLSGTLGFKQRLGGGNLSLSYDLPTVSGEGNRARFGLDAPLPITDKLSLNATAGYERSLSTGNDQTAFGLAARYQAQNFAATVGGETAFNNGQTKVVLRAGATGQIDFQQNVSFDANYQVLPTTEGRFTLSYALRGTDGSLLTYHRLISQAQPLLEGALAASYYPSSSFQIRPSAAYRINTTDGSGNTIQLGLGGNYYLTDSFGVGGAAYYLTQPYLREEDLAWGLEANFRIFDGLWLNAGYTFGGFSGLTPDTAPGFYLRLDFFGGNR